MSRPVAATGVCGASLPHRNGRQIGFFWQGTMAIIDLLLQQDRLQQREIQNLVHDHATI